MLQSESNKYMNSQERPLSDWNKIIDEMKNDKGQINMELLISYSMASMQETYYQFIEWSLKEKFIEGDFKNEDANCLYDSILNINKFSEIISNNSKICNNKV